MEVLAKPIMFIRVCGVHHLLAAGQAQLQPQGVEYWGLGLGGEKD